MRKMAERDESKSMGKLPEDAEIARLAERFLGVVSSDVPKNADGTTGVSGVRQEVVNGRRITYYDLGSRVAPPPAFRDKRRMPGSVLNLTREDFKRNR